MSGHPYVWYAILLYGKASQCMSEHLNVWQGILLYGKASQCTCTRMHLPGISLCGESISMYVLGMSLCGEGILLYARSNCMCQTSQCIEKAYMYCTVYRSVYTYIQAGKSTSKWRQNGEVLDQTHRNKVRAFL